MRLLLPSILIIATVVILCSGLPQGKGKVHANALLESSNAKGYGNPLQRRRPPIKIPGPKLSADEDKSISPPEKEKKMKKLSGSEKDKDNKRKHAVNESKYNGDRKEGIQEEKSSLP